MKKDGSGRNVDNMDNSGQNKIDKIHKTNQWDSQPSFPQLSSSFTVRNEIFWISEMSEDETQRRH